MVVLWWPALARQPGGRHTGWPHRVSVVSRIKPYGQRRSLPGARRAVAGRPGTSLRGVPARLCEAPIKRQSARARWVWADFEFRVHVALLACQKEQGRIERTKENRGRKHRMTGEWLRGWGMGRVT